MSRIAVIGSGISGLGLTYLASPQHEVTLYEKAARIGGHTRTVTVDYDGVSLPVDTGFIVFNERNYPHLTGLFRHLGVAVRKSSMSFGVTVNNGEIEWGAENLNAVFGQRRNLLRPGFYRMLADLMRFNRTVVELGARLPNATLGELLAVMRLGPWFLNYYLLPMGGAIWSVPPSQMLDFPAATFIRFFENHGLLTITQQPQWYTVTGGSQEYVKKLTAAWDGSVMTKGAAVRVTRLNDGVEVTDSQGEAKRYDRVAFACHANEALALLTDPTDAERAALSAFTYQKNHAVLHRDARLMPQRKRCWSSWIYHIDAKPGSEADIGVTYWMNALQGIPNDYPLFVTLNPTRAIAPELIFDTHDFEHPVFTQAAIAAQSRVASLQGENHTWYAGAHLRYGFHEDGLLSAVNIARDWKVGIPWQ